MLFVAHDFFSNFEGIKKSKDKDLMKDVLYSEIVKLIAFHKKELVANVKALGYKFPNTKDETVVDFIFRFAGSDKKVADVIANMIIKYNKETTSGADGEFDYSTLVPAITGIVGSISGAVAANKNAKAQTSIAQSNAQAAVANAQAQNDMLKAVMAQKGTGLSTGAIIGIAAGGAVVLGLILYLALRK